MIGYLVLAGALDLIYRLVLGRTEQRLAPSDWLFNAAAFSGSATIGIGIFDDGVMRLFGDTTAYLTLAAAGLGHSLRALLPRG